MNNDQEPDFWEKAVLFIEFFNQNFVLIMALITIAMLATFALLALLH